MEATDMDRQVVEACPLCGSGPGHFSLFETAHDAGEQLRYVLCARCGLVFQSPRPTGAALEQFYHSGYRQLVQGSEAPIEKDLRIQAGRARHLLRLVKDSLGPIDRLLDIGSSTGMLLEIFRSGLGCEVIGVEPGNAYRQWSQDKGVGVYANLDDLPDEYKGSFDLVTMAHVLEHLPDPLTALRSVGEDWLRPGGWILVEVPNLYGHKSLEFSHLTAFDKSTLKALLQLAGYRVKFVRTQGEPRSLLIPLYLTSLAQWQGKPDRGGPPSSSARGVRLKRKLGLIWRSLVTRLATRWAWLPFPELRGDSGAVSQEESNPESDLW